MIEIIPGIYQINLPLSGYPSESVNIYLVQGKRYYLLIDAGWNSDSALNSLQKQLDLIGIGPDEIKKVIVTHCHHDHYDMASRFKKVHGARIYLHRADLEIIKARASGQKFLMQLDRVLRNHGMPESELAEVYPVIPDLGPPALPDVLLEGGETIPAGIFNFQVMWTPGHTPGQISLYEPTRKLLFPGDMVMPTRTCSTSMHLDYSQNPLSDYLNSLQYLKKLDVKLVLPGHEHVFSNLSERIDDLIQRRQRRNLQILKVLAGNRPMTAFEVALALSRSSKNNSSQWKNMTPMDKRFTVSETISHLQALTFNKQIEQVANNGYTSYRLPDSGPEVGVEENCYTRGEETGKKGSSPEI